MMSSIHFSMTSLMMSILWGCVLISLCSLFLRKSQILYRVGSGFIVFLSLLAALRILLPYEYGYTISLYSHHIMPVICDFFRYSLGTFLGIEWHIYSIFLFIWLSGSIIKSTYYLYSYIHFRRFVRTFILPEEKASEYHRVLSQVCNMKVKFRFAKSKQITSPAITGFFHPVILLPDLDFTEQELSFIFLHETAHFKRLDLLIMAGLDLLSILYWWNPFVSLLKKEEAAASEMETDKQVLQHFSPEEQLDYLELLLKVQRYQKEQNRSSFALSISSRTDSTLLARAKYMTNDSSHRSPFLIFLVGCSLFLFSTLFIIEPSSVDPEVEAETFSLEEESSGYLIKNPDGTHELYLDGVHIGTITTLEDDEEFQDYPIYNSLEEVPNE